MAQVVLITGASSGIGKSMADLLSQKGFTVYGTSRNPGKYRDLTGFTLLEMDVGKPEGIEAVVAQVTEAEGRIDVLVNNAGVGMTGPVEEMPEADVHRLFDTNFHGPIRMAKAVLPAMRKQGSGLIINITSIAGYIGLPYRGYYSAVKGALELLMEAMRIEVKPFGVHMVNLAPGDFATNIAAGRLHTPPKDGSPYKEPYSRVLKQIDGHVDSGEDPVQVADAVLRIINTKTPRPRYKAGRFMQKFSARLKYLLPGLRFEKMLMKHYKL